MKCLQYVGSDPDKYGTVTRVSDQLALSMVLKGSWVYISKTEYKHLKVGASHAP